MTRIVSIAPDFYPTTAMIPMPRIPLTLSFPTAHPELVEGRTKRAPLDDA
ncbi:MAG: hypothetical protein OXC55_09040 [Chloroflexi bacterium]|nr:hypothetical protein [Chloroflexota bacterium]